MNRDKTKMGIAAAVALGVLGAHVVATALYLIPDSPTKRSTQAVVGPYMHTLWEQNWHLFSPNPPTQGETLVVQCVSSAGLETPWVDTSQAVVRKTFESPLGPYAKLRYIYKGVGEQLLQRMQRSVTESCNGTAPSDRDGVERCTAEAERMLTSSAEYAVATRFATDACRSHFGNVGDAVSVVRLRWMKSFAFPFSKRSEIGSRSAYKTEYVEFPTFRTDGQH